MTQKDVLVAFDKGELLCKGVYWSGRIDTISFRDKKTGNARTAHVCREIVLRESDNIVVSRFLKDDEEPTKWKPSAAKNQPVAILVSSMETSNGQIVVNGRIEPLV